MATITEVRVSYGLTQSLPEYSNVKPQLSLTATLHDDDDPAAVERELWQACRASVHEQVDQALESVGRAARYSDAPRFKVLRTSPDHRALAAGAAVVVVILPNELVVEDAAQSLYHANYSGDSTKLRSQHALRVAAAVAADCSGDSKRCILVDCSTGDLSALEQALVDAAPTQPVADSRRAPELVPDDDDDDDDEDADDDDDDVWNDPLDRDSDDI
jgi:hypothetical protein